MDTLLLSALPPGRTNQTPSFSLCTAKRASTHCISLSLKTNTRRHRKSHVAHELCHSLIFLILTFIFQSTPLELKQPTSLSVSAPATEVSSSRCQSRQIHSIPTALVAMATLALNLNNSLRSIQSLPHSPHPQNS